MKFKALTLAALTGLSSVAMAQNLKGYVGLGGGSAFSSVKDSNSGQTKSESASAVSFFGGVKFNENMAVEAEHISTGDIKLTGAKVKVSGYGVSAVFNKPVGNWSFFGKLGVTSLTSKLSADPGYVLTVKDSQTKTGVMFGGGAEYAFTPNAALRLSLSSYDMEAGDGAVSGRLGAFLVSGVFSF
jgi:opacity protein-like surface antigen